MMEQLITSPFFGIALTALAYALGMNIQKRTGLVICNGLVLATIMVIIVLTVFHIPYEAYYAGGSVINLFLSPATVCLAVSIYNKKDILKKNLLPVLAGCTAGSVASVLSVALGCRLFGLDRALTASLLLKSVTTPIATALAEGHARDHFHHCHSGHIYRHGGKPDGALFDPGLSDKKPAGGRTGDRHL